MLPILAVAAAALLHSSAAYSVGSLPPILQFVNGTVVKTPQDYAARQAEIASLLQQYFYGTMPDAPAPAIAASTLLNTTLQRGANVSWWQVQYSTPVAPSVLVFETISPAYCMPASPCPAFFASKEHRRWALIAVTRGYIAINYPGGDNSCADGPQCQVGDPTAQFQRAYPNATFQLIARRAYLASRVLDWVLAVLPGVNTTAIGVTGHSRNGKQSLIIGGFDPRFTAIVDSSSGAAGISAYRLSGGPALCETPASGWPGPWFLPSLKTFDGREDELPVDSHSVGALIAPRALMLGMALNDGVLPTMAVEASAAEIATAYSFLQVPGDYPRIDYRFGDHHGYEDISRYLDFFDSVFQHRQPTTCGTLCGTPVPSNLPAAVTRFHTSFNFSAWNAVQPTPHAAPAPGATPLQRLLWSLGDWPLALPDSGGPASVWSPGGSYPPASDLTYVDSLMERDQQTDGTTGIVVRNNIAFGNNVISGNMFFRQDMMPGQGRQPPSTAGWPAVVYLHSENYNKATVASYTVDAIDFSHALGNASFVTLSFDQLGFGTRLLEGAQFYDRYPTASKLAAMIADAVSAVDVLTANQNGFHPAGQPDAPIPYPLVDPSRVYVVGYGLGGTVALLTAALDARIAGYATVSGFTSLRNDTDTSRSGGNRRWWQLHATQPRLGWYAGNEAVLPYDDDDALTVLSRRAGAGSGGVPGLVYQPSADRFCDAAAVQRMVTTAQGNGYNALQVQVPSGAINALNSQAREAVIAWLAQQAGVELV